MTGILTGLIIGSATVIAIWFFVAWLNRKADAMTDVGFDDPYADTIGWTPDEIKKSGGA